MQPAADPNAVAAAAQDPMVLYQQAMQQYMAMATAQAQSPEAQALAAQQYQAQVQQYQATLAAQQAAVAAQQTALAIPAATAYAGVQAAAPLAAAPLTSAAGKGAGKLQAAQNDPERIIGIVTKVDDSGDFGFVKFKKENTENHVFLHKGHYTSARHDQILEVGVLVQCKLFTNPSGKQSCTQAYEIAEQPEELEKLKQQLDCTVLDGTVYTGWIVWLDAPKQHGKIRSKMLEEMHPNVKQDVRRGISVHKERTIGLTTRMQVSFQIELNSKDELLGRNVFVVSGADPEECPFPIDDGEGIKKAPSSAKGKDGKGKSKGKDGKGKDGKGKGKGKMMPPKGKGKVVLPPPSFAGNLGGGDGAGTWNAPAEGSWGSAAPAAPWSAAPVEGGDTWGQGDQSWNNDQSWNSSSYGPY